VHVREIPLEEPLDDSFTDPEPRPRSRPPPQRAPAPTPGPSQRPGVSFGSTVPRAARPQGPASDSNSNPGPTAPRRDLRSAADPRRASDWWVHALRQCRGVIAKQAGALARLPLLRDRMHKLEARNRALGLRQRQREAEPLDVEIEVRGDADVRLGSTPRASSRDFARAKGRGASPAGASIHVGRHQGASAGASAGADAYTTIRVSSPARARQAPSSNRPNTRPTPITPARDAARVVKPSPGASGVHVHRRAGDAVEVRSARRVSVRGPSPRAARVDVRAADYVSVRGSDEGDVHAEGFRRLQVRRDDSEDVLTVSSGAELYPYRPIHAEKLASKPVSAAVRQPARIPLANRSSKQPARPAQPPKRVVSSKDFFGSASSREGAKVQSASAQDASDYITRTLRDKRTGYSSAYRSLLRQTIAPLEKPYANPTASSESKIKVRKP
jgi:hypothetical protein